MRTGGADRTALCMTIVHPARRHCCSLIEDHDVCLLSARQGGGGRGGSAHQKKQQSERERRVANDTKTSFLLHQRITSPSPPIAFTTLQRHLLHWLSSWLAFHIQYWPRDMVAITCRPFLKSERDFGATSLCDVQLLFPAATLSWELRDRITNDSALGAHSGLSARARLGARDARGKETTNFPELRPPSLLRPLILSEAFAPSSPLRTWLILLGSPSLSSPPPPSDVG